MWRHSRTTAISQANYICYAVYNKSCLLLDNDSAIRTITLKIYIYSNYWNAIVLMANDRHIIRRPSISMHWVVMKYYQIEQMCQKWLSKVSMCVFMRLVDVSVTRRAVSHKVKSHRQMQTLESGTLRFAAEGWWNVTRCDAGICNEQGTLQKHLRNEIATSKIWLTESEWNMVVKGPECLISFQNDDIMMIYANTQKGKCLQHASFLLTEVMEMSPTTQYKN